MHQGVDRAQRVFLAELLLEDSSRFGAPQRTEQAVGWGGPLRMRWRKPLAFFDIELARLARTRLVGQCRNPAVAVAVHPGLHEPA